MRCLMFPKYCDDFQYCLQNRILDSANNKLSKIFSSMFRILFFSESSSYLRNNKKNQLFCSAPLCICAEWVMMSLLLCTEDAATCLLRTQHHSVKAQSGERSLFSGRHSLPVQCLPVQRVINAFSVLYILLKSHLS